MAWAGRPSSRPVQFNSWEACYFDHDEAKMLRLAKKAVRLGVERFILDDGWFGQRDDDQTSLGDWHPHPRKYPHGLGRLAKNVNQLGMEFGLWVELEMVSPDSDLYRAHPDWILGLAGHETLTARHQLVLNLALEDVRIHLLERLRALLTELPIAYLKWDHNRILMQAGEPASYRQQVLGFYGLLDQLRKEFPKVDIEACAAGAGRIDAGLAARARRFWLSDNLDPLSRLRMQRGFSQFFPPEMMGTHIGARKSRLTGREFSYDFQALVAIPGHLGLELDISELGEDEEEGMKRLIALYKSVCTNLHSGKQFCGELQNILQWRLVINDQTGLLFLYQIQPRQGAFAPKLLLPMLDGEAKYKRSYLFPEQPTASHSNIIFGGEELQKIGLPIPPFKAHEAVLLQLEKQEMERK